MSGAAEIADAHARAWLDKSRSAKEVGKRVEARDYETMSMAAFQVATAIRALASKPGQEANALNTRTDTPDAEA